MTRRTWNALFLLLPLLLAGGGALAAADPQWQDLTSLKRLVEAYVRAETGKLPGKVEIRVGDIDPRLHLLACAAPEAFTPVGGRLWGNSTVGMRCTQPKWSLSVPVTVTVTAPLVVAARPLARNHVIEAADLSTREAELTQLPGDVLTDPSQAIGKLVIIGMQPGSPIKNSLLRAPFLVMQGQKVRIQVQGPGFTVSNEGKALADGRLGQTISIKTASGKVVSGVVKGAGLVEVAY